MDKKGSADVVLLVIMILVLVSAALFNFYKTTNVINSRIVSVSSVQNVKSEKDFLETQFYFISRNAFIKTYYEILLSGDFSSGNYVGGIVKFGELDASLNSKFEETFKNNLYFEIYDYLFEGDDFNLLKDKILIRNYLIGFDGKDISILVPGFSLSDSFNGEITTNYNFDIYVNLFLDREKLDNFESIYSVKENCKLSSDLKSCFNSQLDGFEVVNIAENSGNKILYLESKRNYLIDGDLKKISFSFIIV